LRRIEHACPVTGDAAAVWNSAAASAGGDHLVFLERPLEAVSPDWLSVMLEYSQQARIGAVGPKIFAPDGTIEDAGIVLPKGVPHGVLRGADGSSHGYLGNLRVPYNYLAVSGACLMTRRAVFAEAAGFRSADTVGLPAVDYCLRLGDLGYRVVVTPHAELRRAAGPAASVSGDPERLGIFRARWGSRPAVDPHYTSGRVWTGSG
jgi:GT2 family glycosyltransferase